jgi:fluoride exporter
VWQQLAWLALAGALGALSRYGLSGLVQNAAGASFPWGTLSVNCLGCLLFGLLWAVFEDRMAISSETRAILAIGFLGSFTTFSTFAYETSQFCRDSQWWTALANVAAHNVLGLAFVFVGRALGRML